MNFKTLLCLLPLVLYLGSCAFFTRDVGGSAEDNADNDGDGILNADDMAIDVPEDKDGFEDSDGAPEQDNDRDGISDDEDSCPNEPEDKDGLSDADGCPEDDVDGDGVKDDSDECKLEPGTIESKGCPQFVRIDSAHGEISILQQIQFDTGKASIKMSESLPLLQEIARTLQANRQIKKLRIEGHTDDKGADAKNLTLSMERARSVRTWLSGEGGIEETRLSSFGCGELHPKAPNRDEPGRQANRRVTFVILEPPSSHDIYADCQAGETLSTPSVEAAGDPQ